MIRAREQGILLLPVALTLAIVGALAYTMTRDGSMNVAAVNAQYDIEVARYLATSGVQLAKWRVAQDDCDGDEANFGTLSVYNGSAVVGTVTVDTANTKWKNGILTIALTATTRNSGAVHTLARTMQVYDFEDPKDKTLIGGGHEDTTLLRTNSTIQSGEKSLEATDGTAHPLVYFKLPSELDKASIIRADLKLTKEGSASTQLNRSLGIHRVTTAWSHSSATWTMPWATPGGDYVATPEASMTIDPYAPSQYNGAYTARIDPLVQAWANDTVPNYGMLLKPTRLVRAQFVSFDGSNKPELIVRYYLRCS